MCRLTQDGLSCVWEVYSSVVNDKYVGGDGGGGGVRGGGVLIRCCGSGRLMDSN